MTSIHSIRSVTVRSMGAGVLVGLLVAGWSCAPSGGAGPLAPQSDSGQQRIANPASENCIAQGGDLRIEHIGNGSQIGVCWFEDARQCEEWALMRGSCPVRGRRVTGYVTPGGRYCAIRGGTYQVTQVATAGHSERGSCTLPDGRVCTAAMLWDASCG